MVSAGIGNDSRESGMPGNHRVNLPLTECLGKCQGRRWTATDSIIEGECRKANSTVG